MKCVVLGAGIVGVTTAHALARHGVDVVLVERRNGPALETSFANGGQISPSHSDPWAAPGSLMKLLKWMGRADAPIRVHPQLSRDFLRWARLFIGNCSAGRAAINTERMLRMAMYGQVRLKALHNEVAIPFDHRSDGILHVFRSPKAFEAAKEQAFRVRTLGCARDVIDAQTCLELEPALIGATLVGGMISPSDESGDAHAFAKGLARDLAKRGGLTHYDTQVNEISVNYGRVVGVETSSGFIAADSVVVCLGWSTPQLLKPLGLRVPILPAKGYSVTVPVKNDHIAPRMAVIDDERKLVASRLGNRLRVAGLAEVGRVHPQIDPKRSASLLRGAQGLFAKGGNWNEATFWAGFRPQTPDNVPVLGETPIEGLFLNAGHGTLGWTMSCGAAQAVADVVVGQTPQIDLSGLTLDRFSGLFT